MTFFSADSRLRRLLLQNNSLKQTVFKNTFWLVVSNFLGRLIRAGLLIYMARVLSPAGYGAFSYAIGVAAIFSIFSDIGINGMLTREGAKNPKAFPELLSTTLVLKSILLALTTAALFAIIPFSKELRESAQLLHWAALLIIFDGMRDLTFAITRSKEKMQTEAAINIATNLAITGLGIFLIFLHPTPRALLAGYAIGSGVGTVIAYGLLHSYFASWWRHVRFSRMLGILKEGFLFGMMGLMGTLMLNTDTIMIRHFMSAADLGLYSAAQRPILVLYVFPGIISTVLFPAFSRFAFDNRERFVFLLEKAISFTSMISIPLVFGGLALREGVILLLFGEAYRTAVPSFYLLLFTILLAFPGVFIGNAIFALNKQRLFASLLLIGTLSNLILNYLLIPHWGLIGSAISTIVAQTFANGFTWWKLRQLTDFKTLRYLPKIIIASLVMAGAAFFMQTLNVPVLANIGLAMVIYFGLLFLMKESLLDYFKPSTFRAGPGTQTLEHTPPSVLG
jgi:O-antigen/teichoic acid export membrane protein